MTTDATPETGAKPRLPAGPASRSKTSSGPAPSRIIAAAASVSAGLGLMAVVAGASPEPNVVIEVQPAPVVVQPLSANATSPVDALAAGGAPQVRVVEPASTAVVAAGEPAPVTRSEGS